jgi:hypothetical protein
MGTIFQKTIVRKPLHIRKACSSPNPAEDIGIFRKLSGIAQFSGFPPKMTK